MPDRARLRELLDKATERPWAMREGCRVVFPAFEEDEGGNEVPYEEPLVRLGRFTTSDAALIVEAVNALPGLLDALDEAEKERDAAQTAHGELFTTFTETAARLDEAEKALERIARWLEDRQDPPRYAAEIARAALARIGGEHG